MKNFGILLLLLAGTALAVQIEHKKPPKDFGKEDENNSDKTSPKTLRQENWQTNSYCKSVGESTDNCEDCCSGKCNLRGDNYYDYVCVEDYYNQNQDYYSQSNLGQNCNPTGTYYDASCSGCCPGYCTYFQRDFNGWDVYKCSGSQDQSYCKRGGEGTSDSSCYDCCSKTCNYVGEDNNGRAVYQCGNQQYGDDYQSYQQNQY